MEPRLWNALYNLSIIKHFQIFFLLLLLLYFITLSFSRTWLYHWVGPARPLPDPPSHSVAWTLDSVGWLKHKVEPVLPLHEIQIFEMAVWVVQTGEHKWMLLAATTIRWLLLISRQCGPQRIKGYTRVFGNTAAVLKRMWQCVITSFASFTLTCVTVSHAGMTVFVSYLQHVIRAAPHSLLPRSLFTLGVSITI